MNGTKQFARRHWLGLLFGWQRQELPIGGTVNSVRTRAVRLRQEPPKPAKHYTLPYLSEGGVGALWISLE